MVDLGGLRAFFESGDLGLEQVFGERGEFVGGVRWEGWGAGFEGRGSGRRGWG